MTDARWLLLLLLLFLVGLSGRGYRQFERRAVPQAPHPGGLPSLPPARRHTGDDSTPASPPVARTEVTAWGTKAYRDRGFLVS
jgi:hypothetical protein